MDSAWDRLLDILDHHAASPETLPAASLEDLFTPLVTEAVADRDIDSELSVDDVSRWLSGLVAAFDGVRRAHPEVDIDLDLANLRRLVTRWLHPARPR